MMRRDDKIAAVREKLAKTRGEMTQAQGAVNTRSAQVAGLNRSVNDHSDLSPDREDGKPARIGSPNDPARAPNSNVGKNTPQIFSEADKKQEIRRKYRKIDRLNQKLGNPIGEDNQAGRFAERLSRGEFNYARELEYIDHLMAALNPAAESSADDVLQSFTEIYQTIRAQGSLLDEASKNLGPKK